MMEEEWGSPLIWYILLIDVIKINIKMMCKCILVQKQKLVIENDRDFALGKAS